MASLCRQSAAYHPDRSWKLLAEAEYWEHMASAVLLEQFNECTASSKNLMQQQTANANDADRPAAAWNKQVGALLLPNIFDRASCRGL
jgi:hypothetical protein